MVCRRSSLLQPGLSSLDILAQAIVMVIALFVASATRVAAESGRVPDSVVVITTPQGVTVQAELADTTQKRATGLMFRESLPVNHGMFFTFFEEQEWSFWMKNTRIPLDIIWINKGKRIVHIERNVPICNRTDDGCPNYQPNQPAMYVLELAAGSADVLKLQRGTRLQFEVPVPTP
jgi:uncharacterized membrane protein (UPF0127 family)